MSAQGLCPTGVVNQNVMSDPNPFGQIYLFYATPLRQATGCCSAQRSLDRAERPKVATLDMTSCTPCVTTPPLKAGGSGGRLEADVVAAELSETIKHV